MPELSQPFACTLLQASADFAILQQLFVVSCSLLVANVYNEQRTTNH